ncbi:MAG: 50S ribosomal protein L4 [Thermodesulfobacteriota bacterium]|nr:50S ribosomal protein L4 [Thermodesulfobacteriota bacterium]
MPVIEVKNLENSTVEEINLQNSIFAVEIKPHLFHDFVRMQLSNRHRGTASTKNRKLVRGGGKKPWKQKGTGRARAGTIRSPLWVGGGVVFGPMPRKYKISLPKKVKKAALKGALSLKVKENELYIIKDFVLKEIKTKEFINIMMRLNLKNALIVDGDNEKLLKSSRNISEFKVLHWKGLNVYDILKYKNLVVTKHAVSEIEKRLS